MKSALSVLHVVGSLEGGGAERWVRELAPRLQIRGIQTEIASLYPPRLDNASLRGLGCDVHYRPKRLGFDPVHLAWLVRLMRRRAPLIVHTHQWAGKYEGRVAAMFAGTPIIVHTEHSPLPVYRLERAMAALLSWRTDAVIAFNEHKADLIRQREHVSKFEIIRNGLPLWAPPGPHERQAARTRLQAAEGVVVFGVVGSLQQRKNPALALRAFVRLQGGPVPINSRLDFFGDGPLRDELSGLATEMGIAEKVRFHGFTSDVRELLPGLDVFVTVAAQEMSPISMLEAMVAQLPILGTPHPGTLEMVEHDVSGFVSDWSVERLEAAMRVAAQDPEWRARCGKAGRARVQRDYDIEDIADQHVALYERLTQSATVKRRLKNAHR